MTYEELLRRPFCDVFTVQRLHVVERLQRGEVHRQHWKDTAAFDVAVPADSREAHRRAYEFLAERMVSLRGLTSAPSFVWFSGPDRVGRRSFHDDEHVLHLRVPVAELVCSNYQAWTLVLDDHAAAAFEERTGFTLPKALDGRHETIFDIPPSTNVGDLQGALDRIEPGWLLSATRLVALQSTA